MITGFKSLDSRYWRELYRAALSEIDKSKLPERIAEPRRRLCNERESCFRQPAMTAKRQRLWTT